ncbi:hypothetical protein ACT5DH_003526 [Vibrio alginolyticus]
MSLVITLKDTTFSNPNLPTIPLDYPMDGIEALYRMDTVINGVLQDSSGNGKHAALYNSYLLGQKGIRLDDGYINTPISINEDDITIFAVHRVDKVPVEAVLNDRFRFVWSFYPGLVGQVDQVYYSPSNDSWLFGGLFSSSSRVDANLAEEKWIFTCVSWAGGRYRYFCPEFGLSLDYGVSVKPVIESDCYFNIGQIGSQKPNTALKYGGFNGDIGVVGVYKKGKTTSQIMEIYKSAQIQMAKRGIVI